MKFEVSAATKNAEGALVSTGIAFPIASVNLIQAVAKVAGDNMVAAVIQNGTAQVQLSNGIVMTIEAAKIRHRAKPGENGSVPFASSNPAPAPNEQELTF